MMYRWPTEIRKDVHITSYWRNTASHLLAWLLSQTENKKGGQGCGELLLEIVGEIIKWCISMEFLQKLNAAGHMT